MKFKPGDIIVYIDLYDNDEVLLILEESSDSYYKSFVLSSRTKYWVGSIRIYHIFRTYGYSQNEIYHLKDKKFK